MYINSINDCYLVLKANPAWSFKKIQSCYQKEILKYHKYRNHSSSYRNRFIAMVVAFDCLTSIHHKRISGKGGAREKLFKDWVENDYPLAVDLAYKYLQLNAQDFERNFYKGFIVVKWIVYTMFLIISAFLVIIPVLQLQEDRSLLIGVLLILLVTIPLFKKILDLLKSESKSSQRVRYINKIREGFKYKGKDKSPFKEDDVVTPIEHVSLNPKND